jgi:hypothetical protein
MPVLLHSVTDEGISISKFSMEPVPFNERRDPSLDSPYNALDGDVKSAALYSDFTIEFSKPVTIDQIKVMNGNASDKDQFKKQNRERDIEIILYTTAAKSDKKIIEKKKKAAPKKKVIKKLPEEKKDNRDIKDKALPDNNDGVKPDPDKENKEELKKPDTPEKVVQGYDREIFNEYKPDGVKFILTASQTVIEITDSKKDKASNSEAVKKRIAEEAAKKNAVKDENENTSIQKGLAGDDPSGKVEPDKPVEKTTLPEIKKPVKSEKKIQRKEPVKSVKKNLVKRSTDVKKTEKKAENKIEKKSEAVTKTPAKKSVKPAVVKPAVKKADDKKITEKKPAVQKKSEVVKEVKKDEVKKTDIKKADAKKTEVKKAEVKKTEVKKDEPKKTEVVEVKKEEKKAPEDSKKVIPPVIVEEKVVVKKMEGVVRIEDDKNGRVLVYASLKDSMVYQNIDLKGVYAVTKIEFRTRDDEYYMGSEADRSGITEIGFFNNGKRVSFQGIEDAKRRYTERYNNTLRDSLSGETFVMLENNEVVLRAVFRRDGKIEFHDRFKCARKGDPDCTSLSMPDAWRVENGKLLMRYHTLWRVWKYELDSQSDMLDEKGEFYPPRWIKIYYKTDNGFTDKYLDLVRIDNGIWAR